MIWEDKGDESTDLLSLGPPEPLDAEDKHPKDINENASKFERRGMSKTPISRQL